MDKRLGNKGFTLAELLVVVAIIAVLVVVSIPIFTGQLDKARDTVCKNNIETIRHLYVVETLQNGAPANEAGEKAILAKAITQADDGNYIAGTNTYKAACGGTCTATFSVDRMSIVKIECDTHGKEDGAVAKVYTTEELMEGLGEAIKNAGYDETINMTKIYSNVINDDYNNFLNNLSDNMKEALKGKGYVVESLSGRTFSDYRIVYYNGELDKSVYGKNVEVSIINKDGNITKGKRWIQSKTDGDKIYYIISEY